MQGSGQQLPFASNPNQVYRIVSAVNPNFCLDCAYDAETQGRLVLYSLNDGNNQKWRIMSDPEGNFGFMNLQNSGVLQLPAYQQGKGPQCLVSAPSGSPLERWRIVPAGKGFAIKSAANLLYCLDICEEKVANNTKIIAWEFGVNKINQQWKFIPA